MRVHFVILLSLCVNMLTRAVGAGRRVAAPSTTDGAKRNGNQKEERASGKRCLIISNETLETYA